MEFACLENYKLVFFSICRTPKAEATVLDKISYQERYFLLLHTNFICRGFAFSDLIELKYHKGDSVVIGPNSATS